MNTSRYVDSNGHAIVWSYDSSKGGVWSRPRYFGEFCHLDGTPACDGEFHSVPVTEEEAGRE